MQQKGRNLVDSICSNVLRWRAQGRDKTVLLNGMTGTSADARSNYNEYMNWHEEYVNLKRKSEEDNGCDAKRTRIPRTEAGTTATVTKKDEVNIDLFCERSFKYLLFAHKSQLSMIRSTHPPIEIMWGHM